MWRTIAGMSPVGVDTTGRPAANASRIETGWLSTTDAFRKMSASAHSRWHRLRVDPSDEPDPVGRQTAQPRLFAPVTRHGQGRVGLLRLQERERLENDVDPIVRFEVPRRQQPRTKRLTLAVLEAGEIHDVPNRPESDSRGAAKTAARYSDGTTITSASLSQGWTSAPQWARWSSASPL